MTRVADVLKKISKEHGEAIAHEGAVLWDAQRLRTGVFPFDLASGGGFPAGRISIVWGQESSMKTTLCLLAVAAYQQANPEMRCVFVDVETSYDPEWGALLGVDNDKLIYVMPDYAEQAVDIVESFLMAEDVGIVVVDSLAALITFNEADNSADRVNVGGSALVVGKLYRKATLALSRSRREGRLPTLIAINQIRYKIGVTHGNPETMPGGQAFKFASSLTVRLYGKDENDKKVHPHLPSIKIVSGIIQKFKVPVAARNFEFRMGVIDAPDHGVTLGKVDDWNTVAAYAKDFGLIGKVDSGGWHLFGEPYPTLKEIRAAVGADADLRRMLEREIIRRSLQAHGVEDDEA